MNGSGEHVPLPPLLCPEREGTQEGPMVTLFILVIASILLRGAGWLGVRWFASWRDAVRVALAIMFLFTGATHFSAMQYDYLAMIPESLPKGLWVIYLTGLLEIVGAIGLLIPRLQRVA